jgi:hypothetical protein
VAFGASLNRVNGTKTDGTKVDMWWRSTVGYRKIDGRWLITHRHDSVPFDMETGEHRSISRRRRTHGVAASTPGAPRAGESRRQAAPPGLR